MDKGYIGGIESAIRIARKSAEVCEIKDGKTALLVFADSLQETLIATGMIQKTEGAENGPA